MLSVPERRVFGPNVGKQPLGAEQGCVSAADPESVVQVRQSNVTL
jgi:hypothetical protein